ncbi:MAG: ShlB/FhaC/HecB family hemolysin secretion/activation protein, partial [Candidatus Tectomicrobia bacterium]
RAGVIMLQVIEGELARIEVAGNRWFRDGYIRRRLALDITPPLHLGTLQQRLQRLQQDSRIERLQAELRPGVRRGESVLHVRVEETLPFQVVLEFNNYRAPSVGAERGLVTAAHQNLTGHGDILSVTYGITRDLDLQIDAGYTLPLSARDTTVNLRYRRDETNVVEEGFASLDIDTTSEVYSITLRHPFYRTLRQEFAMAFNVERLRSETLFRADDFPGPLFVDEAIDTALRVSQAWTERTQNQVVAARSRFSLGLDALGATIRANSDLPDGRFFAWLGQFQWVRRLGARDLQLLVRLDVQLTTEPLFPLEQISVGGRFSVRGYRENQLVRDNGLIVSLESRLPLLRNRPWADIVQVAAFVDFGRGWNRKVETPNPTTLVSIGLGLRWALTWDAPVPWRTQLEVFWGYPLKEVDTPGGDLQDLGLHLQLVMATL